MNLLWKIKKENLKAIYRPKRPQRLGDSDGTLTIFGDNKNYCNLLKSLQKEGVLFSEKFAVSNGVDKEISEVDTNVIQRKFYYLFNISYNIPPSEILLEFNRDTLNRTIEKFVSDTKYNYSYGKDTFRI